MLMPSDLSLPVLAQHFIAMGEILLRLPCVVLWTIARPLDKILSAYLSASLDISVIENALNLKLNVIINLNRWWRWLYPTIGPVWFQQASMEHIMQARHRLWKSQLECHFIDLLSYLKWTNPLRQQLCRARVLQAYVARTEQHLVTHSHMAIRTAQVCVLLLPLLCSLKAMLSLLKGLLHEITELLCTRDSPCIALRIRTLPPLHVHTPGERRQRVKHTIQLKWSSPHRLLPTVVDGKFHA
mmetsp:Transcript_1766/g.3902  ORF Transcript_1766/g.3902 Transcript_1766/m.3902 type:complete len:241 (-) Transcript_1766:40-762(-)